jgi:hypothetical protein
MSTDWIRYCKLGSDEHRKRLKEHKYRIETNAQVGQIVKLISERAQIPVRKAEYLLCMILSNKASFDVIIHGYNLYYCVRDENGEVLVRFIDGENGVNATVRPGGFQFGSTASYYPAWAKPHMSLAPY